MKIYLAASYERRLEIAAYAEQLREDGHVVTSRWLTGEGEQHSELWCAQQDLQDMDSAWCQINFTEGKPGRGGRQFEFGYAYCRDQRIILVGPREHVFHYLSDIEQYDTFEEARQMLRHVPSEPKGGDAYEPV